MSYDLNFWRYADETRKLSTADHLSVYEALCDGLQPDGLADLPLDDIQTRLTQVLQKDWSWAGGAWTKPGTVIEFRGTKLWIRFDLRGSWRGEDANTLIDVVAGEFRCPLLDPQIRHSGERFPLPEEGRE